MITLQQAEQLCILAHKDQWRKPTTVKTDSWDCYKQVGEQIMANGDKLVWCNGDTFLVYKPFHDHPQAVAAMMDTEYRKTLALLHDVVEDTHYDLYVSPNKTYYAIITDKEEYPQFKITEDLYIDLGLLTKDPSLTYEQNIRRIKDSGRADPIAVKIGDNTHNLSTGTPKQQAKYLEISLPILLEE